MWVIFMVLGVLRKKRGAFPGRLLALLLLLVPLEFALGSEEVRFTHYSTREGLSHSSVCALLQDDDGFLWAGTLAGLNRFDGYNFKVFKQDSKDPFSLSDNYVRSLVKDSKGRIWVGTSEGLDLYDAKHEHFVHYSGVRNTGLPAGVIHASFVDRSSNLWVGTDTGLYRYLAGQDRFQTTKLGKEPDLIRAISQDQRGNLWLGTPSCLIHYNLNTFKVTRYSTANGLPDFGISNLLPDGAGGMWIGTLKGLARYLPGSKSFQVYQNHSDPDSLASSEIKVLFQDPVKGLWVGTGTGGLDLYNQKAGKFIHHVYNPNNPKSLSNNNVLALMQDRLGILWIGTDAGLNKYNPDGERFGYRGALFDETPQPGYQDVRSLCVDAAGELWLGTYGNGLTRYAKQQFSHYRHDPNDVNSLSGDIVWMVREDRSGHLWVGTDSGLNLMDPARESFVQIDPVSAKTDRLKQTTVYSFLEPALGDCWFGSQTGLYRYQGPDQDVQEFLHQVENPDSLSSSNIWSLAKGDKGRLWVGTGTAGLNDFDPETGRARRFVKDSDNAFSLSNDLVYCLLSDPQAGSLWVGTHAGLNYHHRDNPGHFVSFHEKEGLPNATICGILADDVGYLWISTKRGLVRFDPKQNRFKPYFSNDGLQSDEFNENASFVSQNGQMYLGGVSGINVFRPELILEDKQPPTVHFTKFFLFNNEALSQKRDPSSPLTAAVMHVPQIVLESHYNMLSLEFTGIQLASPERNSFSYRLDGHDQDWIPTTADKRFATYTSLAPGQYLFRVKAANKDHYWGEESTLRLIIKPPLWRSWWAKMLYVLGLLGLLYGYAILIRGKLKKEQELVKQLRKSAEKDPAIAAQLGVITQRLSEIDRLKDEFLTNTSHELRTPLNGIIGLAETLLEEMPPGISHGRTHLELIVSSGRRLATLVNDILDFSQLKSGSLNLDRVAADAHSLAEAVVSLLLPLAERNGQYIENKVPQEFPLIDVDEGRFQQILYNLLGNSLKFTGEGRVTLSAHAKKGWAEFCLSDAGPGIPSAKLARIFESFEQGDGSDERVYNGSGLGLAITQRLVVLHNGSIDIESKEDSGTLVIFSLPFAPSEQGKDLEQQRAEAKLRSDRHQELRLTGNPFPPLEIVGLPVGRGTHVLVVDDEPINRRILVSLLMADKFRVTEAEDGPTALGLIEMHSNIDIVLLDIMMPGMSGYDVCRKIRETQSVHELPVIMLTAKNQKEDLVHGFESGANDYLVKPISRPELMSRVRTHLSLLHTNRHLEEQVSQRTKDLLSKNEEIVRTQQQLVMQEKMVSLGILTAGISHEINNPTNFVFAGGQNLRADLAKFADFLFEVAEDEADQAIMLDFKRRLDELNQHVHVIMEGATRIRGIVRDLHTFSRKDEAESKTVILEENIKSTVNLVSAKFQDNVQFLFEFSDPLETYCKPAELNQVFMNLIVNSCQAIEKKQDNGQAKRVGTVVVRTRRQHEVGIIEFQDDGCGIASEVVDHIFEPFFTTKEVGEGTGLGLSISYRIVKEHGGELLVFSTQGEGATFRLILPMIEDFKNDLAVAQIISAETTNR